MVQVEVEHRHLGITFDIAMEAQVCGGRREEGHRGSCTPKAV